MANFFGLRTIAFAMILTVAESATAAIVFVTDDIGNVWQYDSIADMGAQTASTNTGTLVRNAAAHGNAYATDQDVTMDLSSHIVYRITGAGDVIHYATVADYLHNTNPVTDVSGLYVGAKAVNGFSYDGGTPGRFYSIIASGSNAGDIGVYNSLNRVLTVGTASSFMTSANYTGAVLNFYDPDSTPGTTVGNAPTLLPKPINAHYYQVASNGRLEGFESLTDYNASSNNRINASAINAFGGTSTFKAVGAFAVPAEFAAIPEATSFLIWFGVVVGATVIRRR